MEQYYRIAGLTVAMDSFGRTIKQARPYAIYKGGEIDIIIQPERKRCRETFPNISDDLCEYLATGSSFYRQLLNFNGTMLHSSAVVVDGYAYLFSAPCGTGKSTHTQLWLKLFGKRAYILNDDKPALRCEGGIWYAYGTPWSGKHDISVNTRVPVAGIAMIERGDVNEIMRWTGADVVASIMKQVNRPPDMASRIRLLEVVDKLISQITIWKLRCNMDEEAAIIAYEAMADTKYTANISEGNNEKD